MTLQPSGLLLRAHRINAGLTQVELAMQAQTTAKYVSELEREKKAGGVRTWKRLADALGIEVIDLIPTLEKVG